MPRGLSYEMRRCSTNTVAPPPLTEAEIAENETFWATHAPALNRLVRALERLAMQVRDESGKIQENFELPDQRYAISRNGRYSILLAVVRGQPNDLVLADLEFALRRIEDRFRDQFQEQGSALLHTLQPFLEDCLLNHSFRRRYI